MVIVTHHKPDADALGSSLGLAAYLRKKGHTVTVISPSDYPQFLHWMPGNDSVMIYDKNTMGQAAEVIRQAEIIFCLDFSALSRINELGQLVKESTAKKMVIDHHPEPEHFADFEEWDDRSASASGLVYYLLRDLEGTEVLDVHISSCLYAGLLTDTGGFRHSNVRREEFLIAADLVEHGANPSQIARFIYDTNSLDKLRLTGFVLFEKLQVLPAYRTAYMTLTLDELKRFGSQTGDTEGFVNFGLSVQGVRLSALIYDGGRGEIKLSFRSLGEFSVNEFARKHFSGGGHRNAAGGQSTTTLQETLKKFLSLLDEYKDQLNATS